MNIINKIYYRFFPKKIYTYAELKVLEKKRKLEKEIAESHRKVLMEIDKDFSASFPMYIEIYFKK